MQVGRLSQRLPSHKCDLAAMSAFLNEQMHEGQIQDPEADAGAGEEGDDFLT